MKISVEIGSIFCSVDGNVRHTYILNTQKKYQSEVSLFLHCFSLTNHFPANGSANKSQKKKKIVCLLFVLCQLRTNGLERISTIVWYNIKWSQDAPK